MRGQWIAHVGQPEAKDPKLPSARSGLRFEWLDAGERKDPRSVLTGAP